ncbi:ABC transporter ATP-binding protein [Oribacterium sp. oral taxon 102]|uniref:ABC transporter ATP-binding protein n=1 Tax=Oribacterium sp. oral taxon 102 TaxID=671214 RepID=UPI0015BFD1CC|nr:ABC transporter ATP-binding protein [Oribacterium sp. oral taxon 102]NWO20595.1 ABC transporter ATP-binding protein [Oribacterium sp. oral taxon 102]
MKDILQIRNLTIDIKTQKGTVHAVRGVTLTLGEQETLALVGESGCGKSMTMKGVMGLLPQSGRVTEGSILFNGRELTQLSEREMQRVRGGEISMIFQDPMSSLNPTMRIGRQIEEMLRKHRKEMNGSARRERALSLLSLVGISNPETRYRQYPHQLSGGMRQRVVIAIALACEPKVLIADEPTTALDVTIQAQILDLMRELQKKIKTSIILITHNLGVVANIADRVAVMYGGKIVETAEVDALFRRPCHEYTKALLQSIPKPKQTGALCSIPGTPPDLMAPPEGCPFAARCTRTMLVCERYMPDAYPCGEGHEALCWALDPRADGAMDAEQEDGSRRTTG